LTRRITLPACGRRQAFEELLQGPVVRHDGGDLDVLVRAVLAVAADPEGDGGDAASGVERPVAGAVLVQEVGRVALTLRGFPQLLDVRAVVVGVLRRIDVVDGDRDTGLAGTTSRCPLRMTRNSGRVAPR
jgi:hypothetical protein